MTNELTLQDNHPVGVADNEWHTLTIARVNLDTGNQPTNQSIDYFNIKNETYYLIK